VALVNNPTSNSDWLSTYYGYDFYTRATLVLQPEAVALLQQSYWPAASPTTVVGTGSDATTVPLLLDENAFITRYEGGSRVISRKVPGAAPVYFVYDKRNRLIYSQDGYLRTTNRWQVQLYDGSGRPTRSGFYTSTKTRLELQRELNAIATDNPIPALTDTEIDLLTETSYHDYTLPGTLPYDAAKTAAAMALLQTGDEDPDVQPYSELTRGKTTGIRVRVLGTPDFITTSFYYDAKGRVIQTVSNNHRGGTDITTTLYSFTGKALCSQWVHQYPSAKLAGTATTTVSTRNIYQNEYLLRSEMQLNSGQWKPVAAFQYDDLGRVTQKQMGEAASGFVIKTGLQYPRLAYGDQCGAAAGAGGGYASRWCGRRKWTVSGYF
jgi:hypothetical protein